MKRKILLMAILAAFVCALSSCKSKDEQSYPILYVVNGSDYYVDVYCDNILVASAGVHGNSGAISLSNTSVNIPVYVEAAFYDKNGSRVKRLSWSSYYFRWNRTYKLTLNNSKGTLQEI